MEKVKFTIDDGIVFEGFIKANDTWNGFLQPYVTREVYEQVYEAHIAPNIDDDDFIGYFGDEPPSLCKQPNADGLYYLAWGFCFEEAITGEVSSC